MPSEFNIFSCFPPKKANLVVSETGSSYHFDMDSARQLPKPAQLEAGNHWLDSLFIIVKMSMWELLFLQRWD